MPIEACRQSSATLSGGDKKLTLQGVIILLEHCTLKLDLKSFSKAT